MNKDEARAKLRELLPPGTTVATVVQHRTPATTWVRVLTSAGLYPQYPGPADISPFVTVALGRRSSHRHFGVPATEAGTDDEAGVVLDLCRALFGDGWACISDGCPSAEDDGAGRMPYAAGMQHHDTRALNHNRLG